MYGCLEFGAYRNGLGFPSNIASVNLVMGCSKGFFFAVLTTGVSPSDTNIGRVPFPTHPPHFLLRFVFIKDSSPPFFLPPTNLHAPIKAVTAFFHFVSVDCLPKFKSYDVGVGGGEWVRLCDEQSFLLSQMTKKYSCNS